MNWLNLFRALMMALTIFSAGQAYAGCTVSYAPRNDWATGFVVDVTINNSGSIPISNWQVSWISSSALKPVGNPWRAKFTFSGTSVTAVDDGTNPTIPAGGSVVVGTSVSYTGSKPVPSSLGVSATGCGGLYVNPASNAAKWVTTNKTDTRANSIQTFIANAPTAYWLTGAETVATAVKSYVDGADSLNQIPMLVAYNIPDRDCGGASAGGAASSAAYQKWITDFSQAIGARQAIVILEPDAIPDMDASANCFAKSTDQTKATRIALLSYALDQFAQFAPNALVYLDAGNSSWLGYQTIGDLLQASGISRAHGFSLNVSNFKTDDATIAYGKQINVYMQSTGLKNKPFLIDTSRNGNGPLLSSTGSSVWCDPAGRKIGSRGPGQSDGQPEFKVWIKLPGNLDGCAGTAGTFSPDMAFKLINGS